LWLLLTFGLRLSLIRDALLGLLLPFQLLLFLLLGYALLRLGLRRVNQRTGQHLFFLDGVRDWGLLLLVGIGLVLLGWRVLLDRWLLLVV
jgi:hypothetical protein